MGNNRDSFFVKLFVVRVKYLPGPQSLSPIFKSCFEKIVYRPNSSEITAECFTDDLLLCPINNKFDVITVLERRDFRYSCNAILIYVLGQGFSQLVQSMKTLVTVLLKHFPLWQEHELQSDPFFNRATDESCLRVRLLV